MAKLRPTLNEPQQVGESLPQDGSHLPGTWLGHATMLNSTQACQRDLAVGLQVRGMSLSWRPRVAKPALV